MHYALHLVNRHGRSAHRVDLDCQGDEEACRLVERRAWPRDVELWQEDRFVAYFPKRQERRPTRVVNVPVARESPHPFPEPRI